MSVQMAGLVDSPSSARDRVTTSSKKRKHEAVDDVRSSKKKRKHHDSPVADTVAEEPEELATKEVKKKKRKSKIVTPEPVEENTIAGDVDIPDAPSVNAAGSPEPEPDEAPVQSPELEVEQFPNTEYIIDADLLDSADPSCFYSTRISFYVSIPAISLSTARSSVLSTHLAPLLLTYFPPAKGIVLAFADPVLTAKADTSVNLPLIAPQEEISAKEVSETEVFTRAGDEFGVSWAWLTATLLVFRPETGNELKGWTNVSSEGFVGLVSYNYFQTAIAKNRIPGNWSWNGPTREQAVKKKKGKIGRLRDEDDLSQNHEVVTVTVDSQETLVNPTGDDVGFFANEDGTRVSETQSFRVVDTEMVPANDKDKYSLQIDGTLLDEEAEDKVLEAERTKFERIQHRSKSRTPGPDALMSGGLARSREGSVASRMSGASLARRHRTDY